MDGPLPDEGLLQERRKRLAAERTLERTRTELARAHRALVANADRLSLRYLSEREANLRLSDRQKAIVAQRKEAADMADRARRRLWHALEATRDGFALFDARGRLVAANSVYLALFDAGSEVGPGATAEELFRVAAEEGAFVFDGAPEDWVAAQMAHMASDEPAPRQLETFDGRAIRLTDRRAPDGDVVSIALDVSEERARAASLTAARDAAEAASRSREAFLARMGHEMRTPMNGVLGLAELLAERDLDPEARTLACTIRDSARALLTIVDDTLDVSRLAAGHIEMRAQPFDLETTLIDCVRLCEAAAKDPVPVVFIYPLDAPVRAVGDVGRIRQIVTNLLGNALKFTTEGQVMLEIALTREAEGARLVLEVRDTGPGIPEAEREAVFDAFAQLDTGRLHPEGTGLGLTISRGLAERMGGTLAVVPGPGPGACLRLELTLALDAPWPEAPVLPEVHVPAGAGPQAEGLVARLEAAGARVSRAPGRGAVTLLPVEAGGVTVPKDRPLVLLGPPDATPPDTPRPAARLDLPVRGAALLAAIAAACAGPRPSETARVLIADDNATNRFLLERMLGAQGFELDVTADGPEAVAAYRATRPDLILMDISMPQQDGISALAEIRAFEAARGGVAAPAIALTAHAGPQIDARIDAAGFAERHGKPIRKQELLAMMARLLAP